MGKIITNGERGYGEDNWKEKLMKAYESFPLKQLREYFRKPDFSWIKTMVDKIYKSPDNIDEISNKYNIEFEEGGDSDLIITQASYRTEDQKFHIWLSENTIQNIQKGTNKGLLCTEIEIFLEHEDVHRQQDQLNNNKQPYFSDFDPKKWEEIKKYLSQFQEIPAFARVVAKEMFINGFTEKDLNNLKELKLTHMAEMIIGNYFKIGGNVLQQFLKEIFNWFNEPRIKGDYEYKQWLKDHRPNLENIELS
jgi:hypothetical protein